MPDCLVLLSAEGVLGVDVCFAGCLGGCDIGATGQSDKSGDGHETRRGIIWGKLGCQLEAISDGGTGVSEVRR